MRLSWTFTPASLGTPLAGVIWMLGWCMVLMSALVKLPVRAIGSHRPRHDPGPGDRFRPARPRLPAPLVWLGQFVYPVGEVKSAARGGPTVYRAYILSSRGSACMAAGYAIRRNPAA